MTTVGFSSSCARECRTFVTFAAETESKPDVGSSRINTSGVATNSRPMLTRRISPPLIPLFSPSPMRTSLTAVSPSFSITSSTRARFSTFGTLSGRRSSAAKRSASCTVSVGERTSCWETKPTLGCAEGWKATEPVVRPVLFFPARISMSVVFPAPGIRVF